jgi:hypothetical protein
MTGQKVVAHLRDTLRVAHLHGMVHTSRSGKRNKEAACYLTSRRVVLYDYAKLAKLPWS